MSRIIRSVGLYVTERKPSCTKDDNAEHKLCKGNEKLKKYIYYLL